MIHMPPYDILNTRDEPPSLFLTLPDPMTEFKRKMSVTGINILNANNPFTHMGKWNFIDQMSVTDDGHLFKKLGF